MRIGVATVYTPGIFGGAEFLAAGLEAAFSRAGHSLHLIRMPFAFDPPAAAKTVMDQAAAVDFGRYDGGGIDALVCLKFPAYLIAHPRKSVWLLHQHRPAYDLYGTPYGWPKGRKATDDLRDEIRRADDFSLGSANAVFTIAERVCERLRHYNGIESRALYHPPANEAEFHRAEAMPFIFAPSRLEILKRQDLLIRALAKTEKPVQVVFAGSGSQRGNLEALARSLGVEDRVRFRGEISRAEMIALYANCSAVFFGPLDEDYGYVTLEAMLSSKPVITCKDSGGPLEFVVEGETGLVTEPTPEAVADALDRLHAGPAKARAMGAAGRDRYGRMDIGWDHVVEALIAGALGAKAAQAA